jgi:hypothetical protein
MKHLTKLTHLMSDDHVTHIKQKNMSEKDK